MSKVNSPYKKIFGLSLIPIILILTGTVVGIFTFPNQLTVQLTDELIDDVKYDLASESVQTVKSMDRYLQNFVDLSGSLEKLIKDIYFKDESSARSSYLTTSNTPDPEFSPKHNLTVDYSVSALTVFDEVRSASVNKTIAVSANLDLFLPSYFTSFSELVYIEVLYANGVARTYPHYHANLTDPRNTPLYDISFNRSIAQPIIQNPSANNYSGKLVTTLTYGITHNAADIAILKLTFETENMLSIVKNAVVREDQHAFIINENYKTIYHPKLLPTQGKWVADDLNHSIYDYESNLTEIQTALSQGQDGFIHQITYNNSIGANVLTVVPSNQTDLMYVTISALPSTGIYGEFPLLNLLAIPLVFLAISIGLLYYILSKYGMFKNIDLEKLAEVNIVKTVLDNIPKSTDDVVGLVTDKIEDVGEDLRDKVDTIGEGIVDKGIDKLEEIEENILGKVEDAIDSTVDKLEAAEDALLKKRDAFADKVFALGEYYHKVLTDSGVDFDEILTGDFSSLKNLKSYAQKLEVLLKGQEFVDMNILSDVLSKNSNVLQNWIQTLPSEYGISIEDNKVHLNRDAILDNYESIMKSFLSIQFDTSAIQNGDFSSLIDLDDLFEKAEGIILSVDSIDINQLAEVLHMDVDQISQWCGELPPEYGVSRIGDEIKFDQKKVMRYTSLILSSLKSTIPDAEEVVDQSQIGSSDSDPFDAEKSNSDQ